MEIKQIPLSLIHPSPMNPRKTFDEEAIRELADNIAQQGLLQPITVRPIENKADFAVKAGIPMPIDDAVHYEIICGERRYRAVNEIANRVRLTAINSEDDKSIRAECEILAIVRELNDTEAFDAMITENLQRKDVDPMEEAFAFGQLIKNGSTVEEVALRFGKTIRFVQDRCKLNTLIPDLREKIKEGKMALGAAMIISKLTEEEQKDYFKQNIDRYNGFSKESATTFCNSLFMTLSKAVWSENENPDFEGGCGRKCSECLKNTANHGCLFWEMKNDDGGRCTDRDSFNSKTISFILSEIDKRAADLVKANSPLEYGKIVVGINETSCYDPKSKKLAEALKKAIGEKGYEVVNPIEAFSYKVSYDFDDERTKEFLKNGEAYRCLSVFSYLGVECKELAYYVKKDDKSVNSDKNGRPYEVNKLLEELKNKESFLDSGRVCAKTKALNDCIPSDKAFTDDEMAMAITAMLSENYLLTNKLRVSTSIVTDPRNLHKYVVEHKEQWNLIMRMWLFSEINSSNSLRKLSEPLLDSLCSANCGEAAVNALSDVNKKFKRDRAKIEKKLTALGYDIEGKPIEKPKVYKQYESMKAKHPDAILLFEIGDFYECYKEDAEPVADTLGLAVTENKYGKLVGFPKKALDTYLPMLVRKGLRVAICEEKK